VVLFVLFFLFFLFSPTFATELVLCNYISEQEARIPVRRERSARPRPAPSPQPRSEAALGSPELLPGPAAAGRGAPGVPPGSVPGGDFAEGPFGMRHPLRAVVAAHEAASETLSANTIVANCG